MICIMPSVLLTFAFSYGSPRIFNPAAAAYYNYQYVGPVESCMPY